MNRRAFVGAGAIVVIAAGFAVVGGKNTFYSALTESFSGGILTATEAHAMAASGKITLIDIRRADEWAATGTGEGAHRIDLRADDFSKRVQQAADGDLTAPIALICARGVRSARVANQLITYGFTNIIDVPEGMLGSAAGPGWIARGLPLVKDT
ncbi:rhodanese-related sulfurtransferase [Loktanella ponticola]|uniref:Rhodanese-related sulfurtransferase n=1 Tax=Yoonia ponticola TaxID=1524255 RepID=A0A7W9EWZ6_9RHOB|nr:rhodanese-like domain-containing protein [Yoonia ponticola]MBB5721104.1 rhodanese-related sulfurtransferase [Yoonia ponticola]